MDFLAAPDFPDDAAFEAEQLKAEHGFEDFEDMCEDYMDSIPEAYR